MAYIGKENVFDADRFFSQNAGFFKCSLVVGAFSNIPEHRNSAGNLPVESDYRLHIRFQMVNPVVFDKVYLIARQLFPCNARATGNVSAVKRTW